MTTLELYKLESTDPKIKYGYGKKLLQLAASKPELLYGDLDHWTKMLKSENNLMKWTAIDIIGYLSAVDKDNKIGKKINALVDILHGGRLISSNHAIFALGLIAKNKPEYKDRLIKELVAVSKDTFETAECKEIAAGKVVLTFAELIDDIRKRKDAIGFIKKAALSSRNATRKKAETLLKKLDKLKNQ